MTGTTKVTEPEVQSFSAVRLYEMLLGKLIDKVVVRGVLREAFDDIPAHWLVVAIMVDTKATLDSDSYVHAYRVEGTFPIWGRSTWLGERVAAKDINLGRLSDYSEILDEFKEWNEDRPANWCADRQLAFGYERDLSADIAETNPYVTRYLHLFEQGCRDSARDNPRAPKWMQDVIRRITSLNEERLSAELKAGRFFAGW